MDIRDKNVYLTADGLQGLRAELELLKNIKRPEIARRLQDARELDDTEENAEYDAAIADQEILEDRISQLAKILHEAKVIEKPAAVENIVSIGSTVIVQMDHKRQEFTIVGKMEANPSKKKVSNESPIGMALLGAKKGETIAVSTPALTYQAKVIEIK